MTYLCICKDAPHQGQGGVRCEVILKSKRLAFLVQVIQCLESCNRNEREMQIDGYNSCIGTIITTLTLKTKTSSREKSLDNAEKVSGERSTVKNVSKFTQR